MILEGGMVILTSSPGLVTVWSPTALDDEGEQPQSIQRIAPTKLRCLLLFPGTKCRVWSKNERNEFWPLSTTRIQTCKLWPQINQIAMKIILKLFNGAQTVWFNQNEWNSMLPNKTDKICIYKRFDLIGNFQSQNLIWFI